MQRHTQTRFNLFVWKITVLVLKTRLPLKHLIRLSNIFSIYLLKEEEKNKITNQILKFRIKNYICRRWTMAEFNTKFQKTDSVFIGLFWNTKWRKKKNTKRGKKKALKRILERHIQRGNEFARSLYRSCVIKFLSIDVVRNSMYLNCMMNLNTIGCEGNR